MNSILVETGQAGLDGKFDVEPTEVAMDLNDAVEKIMVRKRER